MEDKKSNLYDFSKFASTMKTLVATNKQAYTANPMRGGAFESTYTVDSAKQIIGSGDLNSLISLSQYYWYKSGIYRNFIIYYATMLTYDTLVVPKLNTAPSNINKKKLEERFYKAINFVESLNIPLEFARITYLMILNGAYYGLLREYGKRQVMIQDLPVEYCRTRFKNMHRNNVLEFDTNYFRNITDQNLRQEALESFPPEFAAAYKEAQANNNKRWFMVPEKYGIAFFYLDQKPMLVSTIPAVISLESHRGLEEETDSQTLFKILTQKIPLDKETGQPILELPEIAELHKAVVSMLQNTRNVDVLTTFADIDLHSLQDVRQIVKDNLEKMERSVYIDAGVSGQIFNAEGNLSLAASIKNDEAIMLDIAKMYDNWINYQINLRFEQSNFYWDCRILPITLYNRQEMHDLYLKDAQFGYSKFLPGIAGGTKQSDIVGTSFIENEIMNLDEIMKPLQSSHTQSSKDKEEKEFGAPEKKDEEKEDRTLENEESL